MKERSDGREVSKGPRDYSKFAEPGRKACAEAKKHGSLVKLQVSIGAKLKDHLVELLDDYQVSHGSFLTAVALKLIAEAATRAERGVMLPTGPLPEG